MKEGETT